MSNIFLTPKLKKLINLTETESSNYINIFNESLTSNLEFEKEQSGGGNLSATSSNIGSILELNKDQLSDTSSTLRNYSINKNNKKYNKNADNYSATSSNLESLLNKYDALSETSSVNNKNTLKKINNDTYSATSSNLESQINNKVLSDTSSFNHSSKNIELLSQTSSFNNNNMTFLNKNTGDNMSDTSSYINLSEAVRNQERKNKKNNDINNLISMLTSDSESNTSTVKLENKLKNVLRGGASGQSPNKLENIDEVKNYFLQLKNNGVDVKLNNMSADKFFNAIDHTTTELSTKSNVENHRLTDLSKTNTDNIMKNIENMLNSSTSEDLHNMTGGKKEKKEKKVKDPSVKKALNPGLAAFNKLKAHVMEKLNITSPIEGAKKASEVKKHVAKLNEDIANDSIKLCKESIKYFDENMSKFK